MERGRTMRGIAAGMLREGLIIPHSGAEGCDDSRRVGSGTARPAYRHPGRGNGNRGDLP